MPTRESPGAPTLLLVPTAREERRFFADGAWERGLALHALAGFGPVAAAARTAALVARLAPRRVLLAGIAGTYSEDVLPVGAATCFDAVALDGVGAGAGAGFRLPSQLGLPQWPAADGAAAVHERLALARPPAARAAGLLLTVCAASDGATQTGERRERHPGAGAEDMEGFGVALACALAGVPLCIVRGASNRVGERDPGAWHIDEAIDSARALAADVLATGAAWALA